MSRSLKKGPYVDLRLMSKVETSQKTNDRRPIRTWSRDCTIIPEFVGVYFEIHNGKNFFKVLVTEEMVGHKLGEFSFTRQFKSHGVKAAAETAARPAGVPGGPGAIVPSAPAGTPQPAPKA